jgi:signal transduction histidine kinase
MDGYQFCHQVRAQDRWREVPFLIYTATFTGTEDEQLALRLGADRFLTKPLPASTLVAILHECLRRPGAHLIPDQQASPEPVLMRDYSERLVAKLEHRNVELEDLRAELNEANAMLESRVARRTEELATANRQLESFASFVSHELRAPLRAIGGYARELEEEFGAHLPEAGHKLARRLVRAARQTEQLTEALLTFCRLGRQPLQRRRLDVNAIVRAAIVSLAGEWKRRTVDIVVQHLPPCDGDALLLERVFSNLLGNALKFTRGRETPRVEVGVKPGADPVAYYVRDNGVGFDMRYAALVFEPFQQLHRDEGFEGAGLGLALVRNIVTRHGGSIWTEGKVNEGATFYFSLGESGVPSPVAPAAEREPAF